MVANYCLHTIGTAKTVRYSSGAPAVQGNSILWCCHGWIQHFDIIMGKYRV